MKRILLIISLLLAILTSNAQDVKVVVAYKYEALLNIDKNGNMVDSFDGSGIILFARAEEQDMLSITLGQDEVYNGTIVQKKEEKLGTEAKANIYIVAMPFQGHTVPLQIFEVYDLSQSSFIPTVITVMICSESTGEMIQGQHFTKLSRVR